METTIVCWGYIGVGLTLDPKPETLGGLGFRGLGFRGLGV